MNERKLGPYILKDVLGRGGMGTVYRAEHVDSGEILAVKALAPTYAHDDHFRNRFESEIQALIKLDHPNIVQLVGFGQDEGNLFFAMELVEGQNLFHLQKSGHHFDWREILQIAKDVANGLKHAHDRGVIHRDLKPGNLLRDEKGIFKITDFGIAKNFGMSQNTGENVLGTMDFMSPEQAKGKPVTVNSDLYSLGTVMFTLLSGKTPFSSNSVEESLRNLTKVPPPHVIKFVPNVPKEIDRLIRKLMDKDPAKRVPTAHALLIRIEEIENSLRGHSEAKTAQHTPSQDTFDLAPRPEKTKSNAKTMRRADTETSNKRAKSKSRQRPTVENTSDGKLGKTSESTPDFFNQVTEQQRGRIPSTENESKKSGWGAMPLLLALAVVLGLTGFGIFHATKKPSADELYALIEADANSPDKVKDQIATFLDNYADDERASHVQELKATASAIALHSRLAVRSTIRGKNRLTEIERQFVDIINLAKTDPPTAFVQMKAFQALHSGNEGLEERDLECVNMSGSYLRKISADAQSKVNFNRDQIEAALTRAASETPSRAKEIYQSVIDLYGDVGWAKDLVSEAAEKLGN